jgi:hypothetical protein
MGFIGVGLIGAYLLVKVVFTYLTLVSLIAGIGSCH